jgi:hypothetical protein
MDQFSVSGQFSNIVNEAIDSTLAQATEAHAAKWTPEKKLVQTNNTFTTPTSRRSKAPERMTRGASPQDSSPLQPGWWRKTLASPFGLKNSGPPPKSPKKREHIPCDEVKPASAKKPYHEVLSFEPPIQEGPCWIKHPVRPFQRSPEKKPPLPRLSSSPGVVLDHPWRKRTRRENPDEYLYAKRLCRRTRGCPSLSSPSHSSENKPSPAKSVTPSVQ